MPDTTHLLFEQSERVYPKLTKWYSMMRVASNLFTKWDVTRVGERDFRVPSKTSTGARWGTYDPNFGSIGHGGYMDGAVMTETFFPYSMRFEIPQLGQLATASNETAVKNAFKEAVADGIPEFAKNNDKIWHISDGTPALGYATAVTTVSGNTVYTLDSTFSVKLLVRGQFVSPYTTGFASQYAGGPYKVNSINFNNKQVTLQGTVPSAAATDILCMEGVSGASPVGPYGLKYFNNTATSGTTLGVDRTQEPEIQANGVDCTAGLTHQLGLLLIHKILDRRGDMTDGLVGFMSQNVQYTLAGQIMNIQRIDLNSGANDMKDLLPGFVLKQKFAGVQCLIDPYQDQTRIDFINKSKWGWARLSDMQWFSPPGSNERFLPLYGSDGSPAAGVWFGLTLNQNSFCCDPGAEGLLYNIPVNSGY